MFVLACRGFGITLRSWHLAWRPRAWASPPPQLLPAVVTDVVGEAGAI